VGDYLAEISEDKPIAFYQGIPRFPSAHSMRVVRGEVSFRPYWALDPLHEVRLRSDEEYAEVFGERLTEAVICHLRSAFPIDSCVLAENLTQEIEPLRPQEALPQEALPETIHHSYGPRFLQPIGASHVLQGGSVVKSATMCSLERLQSLPALSDLARLVGEDVAQTIKEDLVSSQSS